MQLFVCLLVCLSTCSLRAVAHLGPDGPDSSTVLKPGFKRVQIEQFSEEKGFILRDTEKRV